MPGLFYEPISRKTFLSAAAQLMGAAALPRLAAAADESADKARVALLSDTHLPADATNEYRGFRPVEQLQRIVPDVVAAQPESVIINGDAARLVGLREDYEALKELLTPIAAQAPIHIGLGNHDDRANFFKVFSTQATDKTLVANKHVSVFDAGPTRFIVLDSLLYVNKVAGLLGKSQRTWLSEFLATSDDRPHVFFVHHTLGDGDGDLLDVERVFDILQPHRKVKAVFYGHSHRYAVEQRGHIQLINLPAVAYNFSDDQPVGWVEATFSKSGVEMLLHATGGNLAGDGETTSVSWS